MPRTYEGFREELISLINKSSMENYSGTPDFILAEYLMNCLKNFDEITKKRNKWYSNDAAQVIMIDEDGNPHPPLNGPIRENQ
jgi:hypothetical protein